MSWKHLKVDVVSENPDDYHTIDRMQHWQQQKMQVSSRQHNEATSIIYAGTRTVVLRVSTGVQTSPSGHNPL